MIKKTQKELVELLRSEEGFKFTEMQLTHEGDYEISDADWNYKDVPHLTHIHQLVEGYCGYMGNDFNSVLIVQKMFGMKFPASLFIYESGEHRQTYFMTLFWFVLIVETTLESLGTNRTRVTTNYAIGTRSRLLTLLFPLARLALKRNYDDLMSGDIPMRLRRGELRKWGYTFKGDSKNYSFYETTLINQKNVIPSPQETKIETHTFKLSDLKKCGSLLLGKADQFGFLVHQKESRIDFFPRLCPHEGADLSHHCDGNRARCPWHGRLFNPALSINLKSLTSQKKQASRDGRLSLTINEDTALLEVVPSRFN
jgi:Rieske [2Fe-2S] domain